MRMKYSVGSFDVPRKLKLIVSWLVFVYFLLFQLIEQEAIELKNKFGTPRRSVLEDSNEGHLDDIDVIRNEEMLLVSHATYFVAC